MNKDILSGSLLGLLGAVTALVAWLEYGLIHDGNLGAGFFPFSMGLLLLALGLMTAVAGVRAGKTGPASSLQAFEPLAVLGVVGSLLAFGLLLDTLGLLLTGFITFNIAALIARNFPALRRLLAAGAVATGTWLLFGVALDMPFPTLLAN